MEPDEFSQSANPASSANQQIVRKLLLMIVVMFAFAYAMVPIYKAICDITGVNLLTQPDDAAAQFAENTQVDTSRKVAVEFDSNSRGAWKFKPEVQQISAHPGELITVVYTLVNTAKRDTVGQAVPTYLPTQAASHFKKIECFCFEQQTLGPGATQEFPVVFVIDPKLPKDINTITLSYTFFEIEAPVASGNKSRGGES